MLLPSIVPDTLLPYGVFFWLCFYGCPAACPAAGPATRTPQAAGPVVTYHINIPIKELGVWCTHYLCLVTAMKGLALLCGLCASHIHVVLQQCILAFVFVVIRIFPPKIILFKKFFGGTSSSTSKPPLFPFRCVIKAKISWVFCRFFLCPKPFGYNLGYNQATTKWF